MVVGFLPVIAGALGLYLAIFDPGKFLSRYYTNSKFRNFGILALAWSTRSFRGWVGFISIFLVTIGIWILVAAK